MPDILHAGADEAAEELLHTANVGVSELRLGLAALLKDYRSQQRLLDRLVHISDRYQQVERERGQTQMERYQRKLRQIEKMVRISDSYQGMLRDLNERLLKQSTHDELTGLPNRRYANEQIEREIASVNRYGGSLCFALADLDYFKQINDNHGHRSGDSVLQAAARVLQSNLRDCDTCARWGGEEFLILLPHCDMVSAHLLCERLRSAVAECVITDLAGQAIELNISISIGISTYRPEELSHLAIHRADGALYQAKQAGRNRVAVAD